MSSVLFMHLRNSSFLSLCISTTGCQSGKQKAPWLSHTCRPKNVKRKKMYIFLFLRVWISPMHWKRSPHKRRTKFLHHALPQLKHNTLICLFVGAPCTFHHRTKCIRSFKAGTVWIRSGVFLPELSTVRSGLRTVSLKTAAVQHLGLLSHLRPPAEEGVTQTAINGALFLILTCTAQTTVFLEHIYYHIKTVRVHMVLNVHLGSC